ncbi:MAG: MBL fold metallo-hydrolase [Clostridia bacterium]|nr:MBL fold metallo-hydrolase [Clostridia bacterium]
MQIITIYPYGFGSNTYALTADGKTAVVIDPAQPRVADELKGRGLEAKFVLLTHCHFDHIGGTELLQERGAKVLCLDEEKPLFGTSADLCGLFGAPPVTFTIDQALCDNEEISLCGMRFRALHTAGHTKGSACYLCETQEGERYLFAGDTLFAGSIGRTDFPTGDMGAMRESLRRLCALDDMPVYAGHNEPTTLETEKKTNPFIIDL